MNSTEIQMALAAVPETDPNTETRPDGDGALQLRRTVVSGSRIVRLLNRWFQRTDYLQVRLDARGTFFWQQINGQRSLDEIARNLARQFSITESESREAVIVFTKKLMTRQVIHLCVPKPEVLG